MGEPNIYDTIATGAPKRDEPNYFDSLVKRTDDGEFRQPQPAAPETTPNGSEPYFNRLVQNADADQEALKGHAADYAKFLVENTDTVPHERAKEIFRLSRISNYPMDYVRDNFDQVAKDHAYNDMNWDDIQKKAPALVEYMQNPDNVFLIKDDVQKMTDWEAWAGKWAINPAVGEAATRGANGLIDYGVDYAKQKLGNLADYFTDISGVDIGLDREHLGNVTINRPERKATDATRERAFLPMALSPMFETEPGLLHRAWDRGVAQSKFSMRAYDYMRRGVEIPYDKETVDFMMSSTDLGEESRGIGLRMFAGATETLPAQLESAVAAGAAAKTAGYLTAGFGPEISGPAAIIAGGAGAFQVMNMLEGGGAYWQYQLEAGNRGVKFDPKAAARFASDAGVLNGLTELLPESAWLAPFVKIPEFKRFFTGITSNAIKEAEGIASTTLKDAFPAVSMKRAALKTVLEMEFAHQTESIVEGEQQIVTDLKQEAAMAAMGAPTTTSYIPKDAFDSYKGAWLSFLPMMVGGSGELMRHEYGRKRVAQENVASLFSTAVHIQALKTAQASPDQISVLAQKMQEEHDLPSTIFFKRSAWDATFKGLETPVDPRQAAREMTGSDISYDQAVEHDADVAIPYDQWAARIAPHSELVAKLSPDMRINAGDPYLSEFIDGSPEIEKLVAEPIESYEGGRAELFATLRDMIPDHKNITEEQKDEAAKIWTARVKVMADAAGFTDPMEFWRDRNYQLSITSGKGNVIAPDAALNQRAHWDTPEFRGWFGGSRVVDRSGSPLVVYHGSEVSIDKFRGGTFFTSDPHNASGYAASQAEPTFTRLGEGEGSPQVTPVYLSLKNPMEVTAPDETSWDSIPFEGGFVTTNELVDIAKERGHDGLIVRNIMDAGSADAPDTSDTYVAFHPGQVKSAIGNVGTYQPGKRSILLQRAHKAEADQSASLLNWEPERSANGKIAGAPAWVNNKKSPGARTQAWNQIEDRFRALTREGESARFWYENSAREILDYVGGDVVEAEKLIQLLAIYSPQRPVFTNAMFALRAYNHWKAGGERGLVINFKAQMEKADAVLYDNEPFKGRKTNAFYANLMHEVWQGATPEERKKLSIPADVMEAINPPVTSDLWMLRAAGYDVAAANDDKGAGRYSVMENLVGKITAELNDALPDGAARWVPHQVQAAIWSAIKARRELKSVKDTTNAESLKKGYSMMGVTEAGGRRIVNPKSGENLVGHNALWLKNALAASDVDVAEQMTKSRRDFGDAIRALREPLLQLNQSPTLGGTYGKEETAPAEPGVAGVPRPLAQEPGGATGAEPPSFSAQPAREGSAEAVVVHYSPHAGLTALDPSMAGTGARGSETRRFGSSGYGKLGGYAARTYFYVKENGTAPVPERTVEAPHVYTAKLTNLYDLRKDALGFLKTAMNADRLEEMIHEAGFDGFISAPSPSMTTPYAVAFNLGDGVTIPVAGATSPKVDKSVLHQDAANGFISFTPGGRQFDITLLDGADISTVMHEMGHFFINVMGDEASMSSADSQQKKDYETLIRWMGYADHGERMAQQKEAAKLAAKANRTPEEDAKLEELTAKEEKLARGLERYLYDGRTPSVELAGTFTRMRAWMTKIYRYASRLGVELDDEVRGVFARMFAADDAIAEAEQRNPFQPDEQARENMTDAERKAYDEASAKAVTDPQDELRARLVRDQKQALTEWFARERESVRSEVERSVSNRPVYRALRFLQSGVMPDGVETPPSLLDAEGKPMKIARDSLERYDKSLMKIAQRLRIYRIDGGLDGDAVAGLFGFSDARDMIQQMYAAPSYESVVYTETEKEIESRYPDLLKDQAKLASAATLASMSDARAEQLMINIRVLARLAKKEDKTDRMPVNSKTMAEAAKKQMDQRRAGQFTPYTYLTRMAAAGREAVNLQTAALRWDARVKQLWNLHLYKAAMKAQAEYEGSRRKLAAATEVKAQQKLGKAGKGFLEAVNEVLARVGVTKRESGRRVDLRAWLAELEKDGLDWVVPESIIDEAQTKSYRDMTLAEIRDAADAVTNLQYLSREVNSLVTKDKKRVFMDEVIPSLIASLQAHYAITEPQDHDPNKVRLFDSPKSTLSSFHASLLKIEELVRRMDGNEINGPWAQFLWNPVVQAQNDERDMTLAVTERLLKEMDKLPEMQRKRLNGTDMFTSKVTGKEYSYLFALSVALNSGNEANLERLINPTRTDPKWGIEAVHEVMDKLTVEDMRFVQGVWDTLETMWPKIAALEERLNGLPPAKVDRKAFSFKGETFEGGYFPLKYARNESRVGRLDPSTSTAVLFDHNYARAATSHGHVMERVQSFGDPLDLSINVIPAHIQSVLHDLTHREALLSINKILNEGDLHFEMLQRLGSAQTQQFMDWLRGLANDQNQDLASLSGIAAVTRGARRNFSMFAMGGKATMFFQNFANIVTAMDQVRGDYLAQGMKEFYSNRQEMLGMVKGKSGEMRHRFNAVERDVRDMLMGQLAGTGTAKAKAKIARFAGYATSMSDAAVAYPVWLGGYRQALAKGMSEEDAVASADRATRLTLGGSGQKDLANVQRNSEAMKWFTMFYTFFSTQYNTLSRITWDTGVSAQEKSLANDWPKLAARTIATVASQALIAELLSGRGPDEDEPYWKWIVRKAALFPFQTIPIVREGANYVESKMTGGYARDIKFGQIAPIAQDVSDALIANYKWLADDNEFDKALMRRDLRASGLMLGLPLAQPMITGEYVWDLATGAEDPDSFWELGRNLMFSRRPKR